MYRREPQAVMTSTSHDQTQEAENAGSSLSGRLGWVLDSDMKSQIDWGITMARVSKGDTCSTTRIKEVKD